MTRLTTDTPSPSVPPAGTPTRITAMMERYDGEPDTVCPHGCGHKLHALRFEHGLRLRTYVCLWPKCSGYRSLVDEDDGDHGRGDDND